MDIQEYVIRLYDEHGMPRFLSELWHPIMEDIRIFGVEAAVHKKIADTNDSVMVALKQRYGTPVPFDALPTAPAIVILREFRDYLHAQESQTRIWPAWLSRE